MELDNIKHHRAYNEYGEENTRPTQNGELLERLQNLRIKYY